MVFVSNSCTSGFEFGPSFIKSSWSWLSKMSKNNTKTAGPSFFSSSLTYSNPSYQAENSGGVKRVLSHGVPVVSSQNLREMKGAGNVSVFSKVFSANKL